MTRFTKEEESTVLRPVQLMLVSLATNPQTFRDSPLCPSVLIEGKKAGQVKEQGDNTRRTKASTSDIGITRNESSDFQRLAAVPERVLEKAISTFRATLVTD